MNTRSLTVRWLAVTAVITVALIAITPDGPAPKSTSAVEAPDTPGTAALRAAIDPETGELVIGSGATGTTEDREKALDAELAKMLSRSDVGLEPVRYPDGRVGVHLDDRFMNASVARIEADGSLKTLCTEGHDEAQHFLEGTPELDAHGREVR